MVRNGSVHILPGKRFGVGRTHAAMADARAKRAFEADLQEEDRKKSKHEKKE